MKTFVILALSGLVVFSCTDKRMENSLKNLEKRVATLEKKSGIAAANPVAEPEPPVNSTPADPSKSPVMVFENTEYDFGNVLEGDVVEYTFKFKNVGAMPLIISDATASCGCTVPEWPKEPIPAGKEGVISVKFNTTNRTNRQIKEVSITSNTNPAITKLKILGMVTVKNESK